MAGSTQKGEQDNPQAESDRSGLREQHPDSWIAVDPGDSIRGTVLAVDDAWSDQRDGGSFYPLLTIGGEVFTADGYPAPPDGPTELKVHAFSAVLYNEVMKHRPEVGELVEFTYLGLSQKEPPKGRNRPKRYRLRVEGRQDQAARAYGRIDGRTDARKATAPTGADSDLPWED